MSQRFGPVRQVAYLVHDIEKEMAHWAGVMGVGPFFYLERLKPRDATFRGKPTAIELSIALSQSGPVQIELIQQHNDAPSQFRAMLDAGLEGQHHVAFWTKTFDDDLERYRSEGFEVLSTANAAPDRNVFFTAQGTNGTLIELSEVSGPKGAFFERIAEVGARWDGRTEPVRRVARMTPESIAS
jgi:hypothetical protein